MTNETFGISLEIRDKDHKLFENANGDKATRFRFDWFARDYDHLEHLMKDFHREMKIILPDANISMDAMLRMTNASDNPSLHTWSVFASYYGPEDRFVIHT